MESALGPAGALDLEVTIIAGPIKESDIKELKRLNKWTGEAIAWLEAQD
jgi:hypothetical protein